MTCIVAIRRRGRVWIGGDSAGVSGLSMTARRDPKVFVRDGIAFGFTSSFRMGQLLRNRLAVPKPPIRKRDIDRWMGFEFVDAVRACFKEGGFATKHLEVESGGTFLVGVRGRIFQIEGDYQVGERIEPYDAVGCGCDIALGALAALPPNADPRQSALRALTIAARFSAGVRAPFRVVGA